MRTHRNRHRTRLALESLERRDLMAGDVAVSVQNGTLVVRGDELPNGVQVEQLASGEYRVEGTKRGGVATTINGQQYALFDGVTRDVKIDLQGGDDVLRIRESSNNFSSPRDLFGPLVYYPPTPVSVLRHLNVKTGSGNDIVEITGADVRGNLSIDTGAGNDQLMLGGISPGKQVKCRRADLQTGTGHDTVVVDNVTCDALFASLGAGNDSIDLQGLVTQKVSMLGGRGTDALHETLSGIPRGNELNRGYKLSTQGIERKSVDHEIDPAFRIIASPYQNTGRPADVNNDGAVSGIDLLLVKQALNEHDEVPLRAGEFPGLLPDADGDGWLTSADKKCVSDALNSPSELVIPFSYRTSN